jgi:protein-tyrosine phosphatase
MCYTYEHMKSPKILFVCLGNICRSPTAEAVFRAFADKQGLACEIDSAGTGNYHIGEPPDTRSIEAGLARGYDMSDQRARQVSIEDFYAFDHILAMDESNLRNLLDIKPPNSEAKVELFLNYAKNPTKDKSVPDPYWSGRDGFDLVLDLLEDAAENLVKEYKGT